MCIRDRDERPFAVLYSTEASRPNVPVNVLVGLEILKAGFGWTDEEMYEHFTFDLQVRYALGYVQLSEGYFAIRTVYEFRRRLSEHMQTTGENLLEAAFEQVTDDQIQAFGVRTQELRMDDSPAKRSKCRVRIEAMRTDKGYREFASMEVCKQGGSFLHGCWGLFRAFPERKKPKKSNCSQERGRFGYFLLNSPHVDHHGRADHLTRYPEESPHSEMTLIQGVFDRTDGGFDSRPRIALGRHGQDGLTLECDFDRAFLHVKSGGAIAAAGPHGTNVQQRTGQAGFPIRAANETSVCPPWLNLKPLALGTGGGHRRSLWGDLELKIDQIQGVRVGFVASDSGLDMVDVVFVQNFIHTSTVVAAVGVNCLYVLSLIHI